MKVLVQNNGIRIVYCIDNKEKNMKKSIVVLAFATVLAGCSSGNFDGLYVGDVSNSSCLRVRSGDAAGVIDNPTLKLTKEGDVITGFLKNFEVVHCGSDRDVVVECRQDGTSLQIKVREDFVGDGVMTNCLCPVNVYFTLYDTEGDKFHVTLNNMDLGDISFAEHSVVEIDLVTLRQAHEEGFDFSEALGDSYVSPLEYRPDLYPHYKPKLNLSYSGAEHYVSGSYWYYRMPCDYQEFKVVMETESDGTVVFRLDTDGQYSADCNSRSLIVFRMDNAQKESYHIKVNPHTVTIVDEDGVAHEQVAYDFEGELKKNEDVTIPLEE